MIASGRGFLVGGIGFARKKFFGGG